jgi:thiol:disulfide interchange protein DsbD
MFSRRRKFTDSLVFWPNVGFGFIAALLLAFAAPTTGANAQVVKTPHVEAELIARHTTFQPGKPIEAALRLNIIEHWHTYWKNPGDSGLPTRLKWALPAGFTAGEIEWPHPKKLPLGPLMNFGYEGEVLHLVTIQPPANSKLGDKVTLSAKADWLVCADVCIPEEGNVTLTLVASDAPLLPNAKWANAFAAARTALPAGELKGVTIAIDGLFATITGKTPLDNATNGMMFYPTRDDVIANAGKQVLNKSADGFTLRVPLAEPRNNELKTLEGVLVAEGEPTTWGGFVSTGRAQAVAINAPVAYVASTGTNSPTGGPSQTKMPEAARADLSLVAAIGLAFLGGLVLNLMPCVFPVLGIKVMGFVANAHGETSLLRRQGAAYFVGVLASFALLAGLMLALRGAGQSVGWGFQMQEPIFVAVLAVLFFLMAMNLSGVFEVGTSIQTAAGSAEMNAQRNPLVGAFTSGVLATVVATPCMAPGLGASVGFTISQSAPVAMLVFGAMAIGLALPVALLSFFPALLRYLPKPGAWMDGFKQLMAFPLYATVVWLVWILGAQTGNDGVAKILLGLTVLALGAWIYGRTQIAKPALRIAASAVAVAIGISLAWSGANTVLPAETTASAPSDWVPFSKEKIVALRAEGKSIFVDFTATWCITCQVNKRVALNDDTVVQQMKAKNVVRMKADWTRKDAAITQALADFGRNGVPLYVLYPVAGEPIILPELLTPQLVVDAINSSSKTNTNPNVATK